MLDVLPTLKDGDSCSQRRTSATENVYRSIDIAIMCTTANTTLPLSYSKVCDTFRPRIGHGATIRTDLGSKAFIDFLEPRAMLNSLVRQLISEARPASIKNRLRHAGPGESGGGHIADRDIVELPDNAVRELVQKVVTTVRNLRVDRLGAPLLVGALRQRESLLGTTIDTLRFNLFSGGKRREVFQAEVDTDTARRLTSMDIGRRHIDHNIQVPVPSRVTRKVGAILDLPFWQRPAVKDAEGITCEAKRITFPFQFSSLDRHPTQGTLAAVAKVRPLFLRARLRVLFADRVDRSGMQAQFLAATGRQLVEVKSRQPRAAKTQRILLPIVAVIPDEVTRTRLPVKQPVKGFHPVTINKNHAVIIGSVFSNRKASIAAQSAPFLPALKDGVSWSS